MAIPRLRTEDGTSYCSNCNSEVEGVATECPGCGNTFNHDKDAILCPSCAVPNLPGSISCMKCGKLLKSASTGKPTTKEPAKKVESPPSTPEGEPPGEEQRSEVEEEKQKADIAEVKRRTQSLWELSEPFEKVIRSRRRRLSKINYLLERTKDKLQELEDAHSPEDEDERKKLRKQIGEIMGEKEEIVNIEEGIAEMERIYRNLLALQESELKKKQEALQDRLESFEDKIEEWTKERNGLKSKEYDLKTRESEIQRKIREIEQRESNILERERELKEKMRELRKEELDLMKMKFTGDTSMASRKGLMDGEDGAKAKVVRIDSNTPTKDEEEINRRIKELEEQARRAVEEREKLKAANEEIAKDQMDVKKILKILDDLLEKLPDLEIKKFADSDDFKLYEKVLEKFEM
jgi:chromosome segregation ATPase